MKPLTSLINSLKSFRPVMLAMDLPYWKQIRASSTYYRKYGVKKKLWQGISYNDIRKHDTENMPWLDKDISEEQIKQHPVFNTFSPDVQEQILLWKRKGYMVVKNFFNEERVNELERSIEGCMSAEELAAYKKDRYQDLWSKNTQVDTFFRDPALLKLLSFMLGREVVPFQTLNFYKGTQQAPHSDSIHFTTEPFGYLIAVWVALEDITEGSGELIYYPGSHTLPFVTNRDYNHGNSKWKLNPLHYKHYEEKIGSIVVSKELKSETFLAKKGDILIWHANLMHGGSKITNKTASRRSLVMHYYAKDVLCYHERVERLAILARLKKHFSC